MWLHQKPCRSGSERRLPGHALWWEAVMPTHHSTPFCAELAMTQEEREYGLNARFVLNALDARSSGGSPR